MALGWSSGTWGQGEFGTGSLDVTVQVTAPGTLTTWGSNSWGQFGWGANVGLSTLEGNTLVDIITVANVQGEQLTTTLNSVTVTGEANLSLTGEQLTTTLNSVTAIIAVNVSLTGENLTIVEGDVDPAPDANVTGEQLTTVLNSVTVTGDS
jgi:hypothetical protein